MIMITFTIVFILLPLIKSLCEIFFIILVTLILSQSPIFNFFFCPYRLTYSDYYSYLPPSSSLPSLSFSSSLTHHTVLTVHTVTYYTGNIVRAFSGFYLLIFRITCNEQKTRKYCLSVSTSFV